MATTFKPLIGTYTALAVTALQSMNNSQTIGWKSVLIDLQTALLPQDVEIFVKLTTANTAPANDKAAYVYICPAITTDGGTTWLYSDGGTGTLPTSGDASYTIANPNDLILLGPMNYTTQQMTMQQWFSLSNAVGQTMPDGFLVIIVDFTGAALSTSCVVAYRPVNTQGV